MFNNMATPLIPSRPPQREVFSETSSLDTSEKTPRDVAAETTETPEVTPETVEASADAAIASKKEEIKAEPVAESLSASAGPVPAPVKTPKVGGYVSAADLKNLESLPRAEQVKYLTEIVYQKGLDRAITTVKNLNDPYLLDLLHDTLVTELFQKLKGPRVNEK